MSDHGERRARPTAPDDGSVAAAAFDALPAQVAVVDADGVIVETNRAWREFGLDNDLQGDPEMVGVNYLAVCEADGGETATEAAAGIRAVLAGDRDRFSLEYPCHSPEKRRWFLMRAIRFDEFDAPHALVMHTEITERKETERRVAAHNETPETVTDVLSHDLRNPLTVVLGSAEYLSKNPDAGSEAVAEAAERVASSAERIDAIIDDAILLARDTTLLARDRVDLGTVATDAWSHVETGDATLSIRETATVEADASLLSQLFENLFHNAVEHAGADVTVVVTATDDGFVVADDGPGIPPAQRDRVFEAGVTGGGGTGMGLAIVDRIAAAHDWTVRATDPGDDGESAPEEGETGGARFVFETDWSVRESQS